MSDRQLSPVGPEQVTVFLVDDHPVFRAGLRQLLATEEGFVVVGEAENGKDAVEAIGRYRPRIAVVDLWMPEMNGIELLKRIKNVGDKTRVLILSQSDDRQQVRDLVKAGADGYVLKSESLDEIPAALRALAQEQSYFSPLAGAAFYDLLREELASGDEHEFTELASHSRGITPRESEIAALLRGGKTNKEIAATLNCSEHTVKCHKSNLMRKIGARNSAEIVAWSMQVATPASERKGDG